MNADFTELAHLSLVFSATNFLELGSPTWTSHYLLFSALDKHKLALL